MTIQDTLLERGNRYGDFTTHADLVIALKETMRSYVGWSNLSPVQMQALDTIMDKVGRIINGDPNYADNWHDIQGYAKLVEDRLPKVLDNGNARG